MIMMMMIIIIILIFVFIIIIIIFINASSYESNSTVSIKVQKLVLMLALKHLWLCSWFCLFCAPMLRKSKVDFLLEGSLETGLDIHHVMQQKQREKRNQENRIFASITNMHCEI